ncbi:MAG: bacillithiol biosynthesis cysteine-adding enzyme BshC [Bacteroidia bacterium]|nr:bacillithiol biosynthesis cysteine-adding enzyme BshC [Bacteroidia bacterium]
MFISKSVDFKNSGVLNELVLRYINKDEQIKPFYNYTPDLEGFKRLLSEQPYSNFDHARLSEIAQKQCALVANTSEASLSNAKRLEAKKVFTITTGHQLCLFTGPLYFIYKIFSAINLAEALKNEFPEYDFVPVYWMASEDHDFEEINNFNLFGKNIKWHSEQGGAVGDFNTNELAQLLEQVKEVFGNSENGIYLSSLFEKAYLNHNCLADATRFLVNELFGEYGLVSIDGNDPAFKAQFKAEFKKDIFENLAFQKVNSSIEKLKTLGFSAQVNPRNINCFLMAAGKRQRIEKIGNNYTLVGSDVSFSEEELNTVLEKDISKISPNVVLRPLYQQVILPNIAYVGGPGELAYWLEYKEMFDAFTIQLPVLVPRSFVMVIEKPILNKITKLNFSEHDFFKPEAELIREFQVKANAVFELNEEKETISQLFNGIAEKINAVDKTLTGSVSAELQKAINSLDIISGKANKALKQKSETEINQIKSIKSKLFPENVPQERHENFSSIYIKFGKAFFTALKKHIQPLQAEQKLLIEE